MCINKYVLFNSSMHASDLLIYYTLLEEHTVYVKEVFCSTYK